eukprot:NODE_1333_length_1465_cov_223.670904_g1106_i0.p1 GENE.NODE_1333_length_1465_cov_223.670904_g1106_i0~~NODE_1333_length_1465_cov_223.670904_g1106_i0.p1  ORF type:complete len:358 (+),score=89.90 NODE_1333_length_1465_cov_223.670904_g1106_i0:293-1366(+)
MSAGYEYEEDAEGQEDQEAEEDEDVEKKPTVNYDELESGGFRKVELEIFEQYVKDFLDRPEDERDDLEEWVDTLAEERQYDRNRVKAVVQMGIYSGSRNQFHERDGQGTARFPNGDMYTGGFLATKRHGKGTYIHGGTTYQMGELDRMVKDAWDALPEPRDRQDFANTNAPKWETSAELLLDTLNLSEETGSAFRVCFSGDWELGKPSGHGVYKYAGGALYKGEFKDGKRHGQGVFLFPNGDKYIGFFSEGKKHGSGTYYFSSHHYAQGGPAAAAAGSSGRGGGYQQGVWENGSLSVGRWVLCNGIFYEGSFDKKNRPEDPDGAWHFPKHGLMQAGTYVNGRWRPGDIAPSDADLIS